MSNIIQKQIKDMNRHFAEANIQMANKHTQKCSTSLAIREMQIKTTMSYYYTTIRRAKIKITPPNTNENTKKPIFSYTVSERVKQ